MRTPLLPTLILGLSLAGAATAQQKAALPPDVNPVSLTRLPPLTRNDLNDEGKAIYDKIVGTGAARKFTHTGYACARRCSTRCVRRSRPIPPARTSRPTASRS